MNAAMRIAVLALGIALLVSACSSPFGKTVEDRIKEYDQTGALARVECNKAPLSLDGTGWDSAYSCHLWTKTGEYRQMCVFGRGSEKMVASVPGRCLRVPGQS